MDRVIKKIFFTICLFVISLSGCSVVSEKKIKDDEGDNKIRVVATTTIAADLVSVIGGDRVNVKALMRPGIDPHQYQASAGDVITMQEADVVVYHGLGLEGKMGEIFSRLETIDKNVIELTSDIPANMLLESDNYGLYDPHVWSDVSLWKIAAKTCASHLVSYDGGSEQVYMDNLTLYLEELDELEQYTNENIDKIKREQRILITAHDAFRYFERAYEVKVKGLQGISTEAEVGTADIRNLADFIADQKIRTIFPETSVPKKTLESLQSAVSSRGFQVGIGGELHGDSLGDITGVNDTYILAFKENVDTIVESLR